MTVPPCAFSVVVPMLDEERYIEGAVRSLLRQMPSEGWEILLMDGGSRDRTRDIARRLQDECPAVRLLDNPGRTQAAAMNLAARLAAPESRVLIRADAHAGYPAEFVKNCLSALAATGATSVVVPMRTVGRSGLQRAIAAAQNSRLGNGGSAHRRAGASRFVDHGHHAAFDRAFFRSLGGYDETFTHNEDAEHDIRAASRGGRIWLCNEARIDYYPRPTLPSLTVQYYRHGRGRARTVRKHSLSLRARQAAPLLLLGATAASLLAVQLPALALPLVLYVTLLLLWASVTAIRSGEAGLLAMAPAAAMMHYAWAIGFLTEWARSGRRNQPSGQPVPSSLDRT